MQMILKHNRPQLSAVLQSAGKLISIEDVMKELRFERQKAAKILSRWMHQGWLVRIAPGLYAPVPLDAQTAEQVIEDPWIIVPYLFNPCYIGGWSAAGHWDFTEQIFRSIQVITTMPVRHKTQIYHGTELVLKHISSESFFGFKTVWRGEVKVFVSDKHRTIIDMLDTPEIGGGIVHVTDCFKAYLKDEEYNPIQLIEYAKRLGNGAVFKRLGFLAEKHGISSLVKPCLENMTTGNAKLDPAIHSHRLIKKWNLWIPEKWN